MIQTNTRTARCAAPSLQQTQDFTTDTQYGWLVDNVKCDKWHDGNCGVVAELTGVPLNKCEIGADACRACLMQPIPRQRNSVTASIGLQIAKKHLPPAECEEVRAQLASSIEFVKRASPEPTGPGTELKKLLSKLGIKEKPGCGCKARAREMDHRGTEWCEANIETIVGWLREEADRQSLPFVDMAARALIRYAIRRAKK